MIRIAITQAAFEAIKATLPFGSVAYEHRRTTDDVYLVQSERRADKLFAERRRREDISDVILRLAAGRG